MKKYKYIAGIVLGMVAVVLCSCNDLLDGKDNPYEGTTRSSPCGWCTPKVIPTGRVGARG